MLPHKLRLSAANFPEKAEKFFSGKFIFAKRAPNRLGYNRYAAVIPAAKINKAVERHLLRRRILARAAKLPDASSDILLIVISLPGSKHELDSEFDKIKTILQ